MKPIMNFTTLRFVCLGVLAFLLWSKQSLGDPDCMTNVVDVTAITGKRVVGPVTSWQTKDGSNIVEHLAGMSPNGELLAFFWSPRRNWQVVNVTQKTGQKIAGPVTSWQTSDGRYNVEHLAGMSPNGDLLVFFWSPRQDWQAVNVSQKTGQKIAGPLTSWQTKDGRYTVEHLAGMNRNGDLLVFFWSPRQDWQAVNVTQKTGQKIAGPLTSWQTKDGQYTVEHLAGMNSSGDLLVFFWSPQQDWQAVNVSQITGQKIAGPVTSWQTYDGPDNVEHLAGMSPSGDLLVFFWSPSRDWTAINVTQITGEKIDGAPTAYQMRDGRENVELLGAANADGALLLFWWKPSRDWQALNLSDIADQKLNSSPEAWLTGSGNQTVEHLAAEGKNKSLLVFWGFTEPRRLTDAVSESFESLKRTGYMRRNVLAILWDPNRPTDQAPSAATVRSTIFGATNSVRDYYLENSNQNFTIENAGVLGWYAADKPASYYWGPVDNGDTNNDGWVNPHVEKWAEAIRKASADFDFQAYDVDNDGTLGSDELAILIVIPQNGPFGTQRGVVGREYPSEQPLVADGVTIKVIVEAYIGSPPNLGLVAHELGHLLLDLPDMYFQLPTNEPRWQNIPFDNPFAAGDYSLMDRSYKTTHLDAFSKLKLGWLRPRLIFRSDRYTLPDVETRNFVWILLDPRVGTDEYFIVENRRRGSSYDSQMADAGGLAVWHIIEKPSIYRSRIPPKPPNAPASSRQDLWEAKWKQIDRNDWGRLAIRMIRPVWNTSDDSRALWDGSDPTTGYNLLPDGTPPRASLRWADGTPSGFALRSISSASAEMNARIEVPSACRMRSAVEAADAVDETVQRPGSYSLEQNYPNPFNPSTTIGFALPQAEHVTLKIFNVLGEQVATLVDEQRNAGIHKVVFEARTLASGVYFTVFNAGNVRQVRRLMLMK